jgi:hypothetical protein
MQWLVAGVGIQTFAKGGSGEMSEINIEVKKIFETLNLIPYFKNIQNKGDYAFKLWKCHHSEISVVKELLVMELWLDSNPLKGKKKNYQRFVSNWLNRAGKKPQVYSKERKYIDGKHNDYKPRKESL